MRCCGWVLPTLEALFTTLCSKERRSKADRSSTTGGWTPQSVRAREVSPARTLSWPWPTGKATLMSTPRCRRQTRSFVAQGSASFLRTPRVAWSTEAIRHYPHRVANRLRGRDDAARADRRHPQLDLTASTDEAGG